MFSSEYYLKHIFTKQSELPQIEYSLPDEASIVLEVYNLAGEMIVSLVNEKQSAGKYRYDLNTQRKELPSGTYYCRMAAFGLADKATYVNVKKMTVPKIS